MKHKRTLASGAGLAAVAAVAISLSFVTASAQPGVPTNTKAADSCAYPATGASNTASGATLNTTTNVFTVSGNWGNGTCNKAGPVYLYAEKPGEQTYTLRATSTGNVAPGPYSIAWPFGSSPPDGTYSFVTLINEVESGVVTYLRDTTGPSISGTCPTSGTTTTYTRGTGGTWASTATGGCSNKIRFTASDATGVAAGVQLSVHDDTAGKFLASNGQFNSNSENKFATTLSSGVYSFGLDQSNLSASTTYTIKVYATDTASPANSSTTSYSFKTA